MAREKKRDRERTISSFHLSNKKKQMTTSRCYSFSFAIWKKNFPNQISFFSIGKNDDNGDDGEERKSICFLSFSSSVCSSSSSVQHQSDRTTFRVVKDFSFCRSVNRPMRKRHQLSFVDEQVHDVWKQTSIIKEDQKEKKGTKLNSLQVDQLSDFRLWLVQ